MSYPGHMLYMCCYGFYGHGIAVRIALLATIDFKARIGYLRQIQLCDS